MIGNRPIFQRSSYLDLATTNISFLEMASAGADADASASALANPRMISASLELEAERQKLDILIKERDSLLGELGEFSSNYFRLLLAQAEVVAQQESIAHSIQLLKPLAKRARIMRQEALAPQEEVLSEGQQRTLLELNADRFRDG